MRTFSDCEIVKLIFYCVQFISKLFFRLVRVGAEIMNKSNAKSEALRIEGNKFFYEKSYHNAMVKYNESLCYAEPASEVLGLAFANRSAIYFEVRLFDNCIKNIVAAKQNKYPEKNIDVLNKREAKCLSALKQSKCESATADIHPLIKLSYPPHKTPPFVADCLELKHEDKYGRYIVTNKCLSAGDIVAIEEPFCKIIQTEFLHQMCSWCFSSNSMDLKPCSTCTKAMFCSDECESKAHQLFHKYECPVNEITTALSTNLQMALRTLFIATSMFGGSIDDLQKYLSDHPDRCSIFDVTASDEQRAKFLAINSLTANDQISMSKGIFEKIFQISPPLNELWSKHGDFIADFLKRQIQIATRNYHEIYCWPLKKKKGQDLDAEKSSAVGSLAYQRGTVAVGSGSYPFYSLLNHHCAPNVIRVFANDRIVLVVQWPIKKGDQLFDNYGYHFGTVDKTSRQAKLQKQYRFKCDCKACSNDWPLLADLKIGDRLSLNKAKKYCRELSLTDLNRKKAFAKYKELCEILEKNQKNFPSQETCSLIQSATAYFEMCLKPPLQFV